MNGNNKPRASIHVGCDKKTFSAQVSNEAERRGWDEKRYQLKNAEVEKNNHYNFSRKHLNFEITKGGENVPLGSNPIPLHVRLQQRHDELGFKPYMDADHPGQIAENSPNCLVNIIFGGDHDVMKRLAFGNQKLDTSDPNADHGSIVLKQSIKNWAMDTYRFVCKKWGEENIIGFCVHCDETSIHAHVLTVPVEQVKKRGRIGSVYVSNDHSDVQLTTKEWKALPKDERRNYTKQAATKSMIERVSYAKVWGETRHEKSKYLADLHTDYHNQVGYKYGLERGTPYDELSDEEKRERKHKDKVTLEAERQAKVATALALQEKEEAEKELNEILTEKEEAEKELKSAKSGIIAKLVNPSKHKKEEEEKHVAAVEEGRKSVMDAVIKATNLTFLKEPTPESFGKNYRKLWDSKKALERQVKEKDVTIAEKDKVIATHNKTINDLNVKVTKLTTEVNGLKYKITLIDEDAVSSLHHQLTTQAQRANIAESEYRSLVTRWDDLWKNPEIQEAWKQVLQRKEEEVRKAERREDILNRLMLETSTMLSSFAKTKRTSFNSEECQSLFVGIIARCMKDNTDPTLKTCRTNAMTRIVSDTCWSGVTEFVYDCCKSWANLFASKVDIDDNVVDSFKDVISEMCLSDHYVSLMGSNGAAHTLTHWDGSQVKGLGESTKRKGLSK